MLGRVEKIPLMGRYDERKGDGGGKRRVKRGELRLDGAGKC